jgi:glycerol transport system ATP-binding protein
MGLILQGVDKVVGQEMYLEGIDLELTPGSRNVLLGRTLAGKTTLLRIMAGLDRPTNGKVIVDDQDVTGTTVRKRNVAMVYQQFINYPSLTVFNNIASPLRLAAMAPNEIDRRVREIAKVLSLTQFLDRLPAELSGGQQQRTAIARALVKDAQLLLLDEPLVNLDYKLRETLREELQEIFKQREAIVVYTTTEPAEALMLGGNVVVVDEGRILQTGPTSQVYHNPATLRVAEVFSDPPINYNNATVGDDTAFLGRDIKLKLDGHLRGITPGPCRFGMRANRLFLSSSGPQDVEIPATVELSEINGSETFVHVIHDNTRMVVQEDGIHMYKIGSEIKLYANPSSFFVYDKDGNLVASPDQVTPQ